MTTCCWRLSAGQGNYDEVERLYGVCHCTNNLTVILFDNNIIALVRKFAPYVVDLLATPIAPTAAPDGARQPWLLRPRISQFVASLSRGHANRLNRAIGGRGTFTLLDSQPCRLLRRPRRHNRLANATAIVPRPPCVRAASPHHRKLGAGYAALPQMARRR